MNFFKKLFSSKKSNKEFLQQDNIPDIYTEKYFDTRYKEEDINADLTLIHGCMKMFAGFYIDNKIEQIVQEPINHPTNLDQIVNEGIGFHMYCKAFNLEDSMIIMFLAMGFNDFLINKYGFRLYKDSEPEFPLRVITLKYNKNGVVLSLYPVEYALKVLNNEATFQSLHTRLDGQLETMPEVQDVLDKYLNFGKEYRS